jgi:hypothetical protein
METPTTSTDGFLNAITMATASSEAVSVSIQMRRREDIARR